MNINIMSGPIRRLAQTSPTAAWAAGALSVAGGVACIALCWINAPIRTPEQAQALMDKANRFEFDVSDSLFYVAPFASFMAISGGLLCGLSMGCFLAAKSEWYRRELNVLYPRLRAV